MHKTQGSVQRFGWVVLIGFTLNLIWEVAQLPLYTDGAGRPFSLSLPSAVAHCFVATLGDTLVVAGTFAVGWHVHQRFDWVRQITWRDAGVVFFGLVILAIGVELVSVNVFGAWSYTATMPLVPLVNVGLLPTIQLATLTLITLMIAGFIDRRQRRA